MYFNLAPISQYVLFSSINWLLSIVSQPFTFRHFDLSENSSERRIFRTASIDTNTNFIFCFMEVTDTHLMICFFIVHNRKKWLHADVIHSFFMYNEINMTYRCRFIDDRIGMLSVLLQEREVTASSLAKRFGVSG